MNLGTARAFSSFLTDGLTEDMSVVNYTVLDLQLKKHSVFPGFAEGHLWISNDPLTLLSCWVWRRSIGSNSGGAENQSYNPIIPSFFILSSYDLIGSGGPLIKVRAGGCPPTKQK